MKTIALLIFSMFSLQSVKAQQVCKDYITDEWSDSRYIVENISGDNIVTDTKTGLMWKQCSEGLSGADCMTGTAAFITWQEALVLADTQNISGFAGYFDWRLPNVEELRSLTAINCYNPSINEYVFSNTQLHTYWSASPTTIGNTESGEAWCISFTGGYSFGRSRSGKEYVRLVLSGQ